MTNDEIDKLWQQALHQSVENGEQFTRYRFAALVVQHKALEQLTAAGQYEEGFDAGVAAEREACAKVCEEIENKHGWSPTCAAAILARGQK